MNSQDFEFVAQLLRKRAGIVLGGDRMYLLESRLAPLARKEGLPSIDDLIHVVRSRREEMRGSNTAWSEKSSEVPRR